LPGQKCRDLEFLAGLGVRTCKIPALKILPRIKNPVKDFCWWDLDGVVVVVVVVVVVQW
jgi:hypothetical protein